MKELGVVVTHTYNVRATPVFVYYTHCVCCVLYVVCWVCVCLCVLCVCVCVCVCGFRSIERAAQHEAKRTEQKAKGELERQKLQNEKV